MSRKLLPFLLLVNAIFISVAQAQEKCGTTIMNNIYKQQHPEIAKYEEIETQRYHEFLQKSLIAARTTADTVAVDTFDIPVVVHIIHNFGSEDIPDDSVYSLIAHMNNTYSLNYDTSGVIAPFKWYVGKARIHFHLATKDPNGDPTTGITRHRSYLTEGGDDQAKMDDWAPGSYYNIWTEGRIGQGTEGGTVLAYAQFPSADAGAPYYAGVIAASAYINPQPGEPYTVEHETGHYFNLLHPWNNNNQPCGYSCGDDDVDDTPPTKGHPSTCPIDDTECATGYMKTYPRIVNPTGLGVDSVQDYPDTANVQNIMDYAYCPLMFTKLQVVRMHAALNSDIGFRNNLWTASNLAVTGALAARPDLSAIPEFLATTATAVAPQTYFIAPGKTLRFTNKSWRDTIQSIDWEFSNGASTPSSSSITTVNNSFTQPGWVTLTMTATGNNTPAATTVFNQAIFVADSTGVDPSSYFEEFNGGDVGKWPMFNYFNNEFKWQLASVGYYDKSCVEYVGYDSRLDPASLEYTVPTGTPKGDYDDMFSVPFNLSGFGASDACNLDFWSAGASRTSFTPSMNDTLQISYSIDGGVSWHTIVSLSKSALINKGGMSTPFVPTWQGDWVPQTISIPAAARTSYTLFRFRYMPNVGAPGPFGVVSPNSTGNNFYMDRIHISSYTAEVANVKTDKEISVIPNPTTGNAFVIVKGNSVSKANVVVTDVTGKTVYTTQQQLNGSETRIEIPQSVIAVKGMYLVQITTDGQSQTEKLVAY